MTESKIVFPRIHAFATLLDAWHHIEDNDGAPGVDGVTLDDFELRVEENLSALGRDLRERLYLPQAFLRASMPKPGGGRRELSIPTVRDRVAQSAAALIVTPILDSEFEPVSFGFRRHRSVAHAIAEVRRHYSEGYRWIVEADIDDFFDEVDHDLLLGRLEASIPDPDFVRLVRLWLTAPVQEGTRIVERNRGLPQGAPISPVLANLYLDCFDEALLARGMRLVRFADDFIVLCKERPAADAALELSEAVLSELQLALDPEKTRVTHFDRGFRFLGHLFLRSLVLPSPNRLQRAAAVVEEPARSERPATPASPPAEPPPTPSPPPAQRRSRRVAIPQVDTALGRALTDALQEAGRESLVLPESPSPAPVAETTPGPEAQAEPDAAKSEPPTPRRAATPFRRTLYIQEQGTVLARQDDRLVVKKADTVLLEVPAAKVDQVFVFGRCAITTPAMTFCLQEDIPVVLLSSRGQYYGMLESPTGDRVSLHRQQFLRAADPSFALATAKAIVRGKLRNGRVLLQRHQRRKGIEAVKAAVTAIDGVLGRLEQAGTIEEVLGHEGNGAARYFDGFARLFQHDLGFARRARRPPTDPVNSLLSFGYTLSFYNLYGLVRGRGLHPYVGHLHAMRDRHPALVSDLVEEFRAPVVDSLVLYLVNSKILTAADFYRSPAEGACLLRDTARKTFLAHFEQKMAATITHPGTGEAVEWRRAMDLQVAHMTQWIRGEVSEYRPMEVR